MAKQNYSNFVLPHIYVKEGKAQPNINYGYGTYEDLDLAYAAIIEDFEDDENIPFALTIGIKNSDNTLTEYYWNGSEFVVKTNGGGGNYDSEIAEINEEITALKSKRVNGYGVDNYADGVHKVTLNQVTDFDIGSIVSCYIESFHEGDTISFLIGETAKGGGSIRLNNQLIGNMEVNCFVTFLYFPGNVKVIAFAKLPDERPFFFWLKINQYQNGQYGTISFTQQKVEAAKRPTFKYYPKDGYNITSWKSYDAEGNIKTTTIQPNGSIIPMTFHDNIFTPIFEAVDTYELGIIFKVGVVSVYVYDKFGNTDETITSNTAVPIIDVEPTELTNIIVTTSSAYACTKVDVTDHNGVVTSYNVESIGNNQYKVIMPTNISIKNGSKELTPIVLLTGNELDFTTGLDSSVVVANTASTSGKEWKYDSALQAIKSGNSQVNSSTSAITIQAFGGVTNYVLCGQSSEAEYDYCTIYNSAGNVIATTKGQSGETTITIPVNSSTQTGILEDGKLKFEYKKDASISNGDDIFYIKKISK